MYIRFTSSKEYYECFPKAKNVYGTQAFVALNADRVQAVRFVIGYDDNAAPRLGAVLGLKGEEWYCPFSAPFGEIAYRKPQALEHIYDFVVEVVRQVAPKPLHLTLPPDFYDPRMLSKISGVVVNLAPERLRMEYNYHYPMELFSDFRAHLDPAFRNHFNHALGEGFALEKTDDLELVYGIIAANRAHRGYPLAMSQEQVKATLDVVKADMFALRHPQGYAASALVYHSAPGIAQVIYWGDAPGLEKARPMNILPYLVLKYYAENRPDIRILDIGPASTEGIPNTGLCRYKEAFGCLCTLKLVVRLAEN